MTPDTKRLRDLIYQKRFFEACCMGRLMLTPEQNIQFWNEATENEARLALRIPEASDGPKS